MAHSASHRGPGSEVAAMALDPAELARLAAEVEAAPTFPEGEPGPGELGERVASGAGPRAGAAAAAPTGTEHDAWAAAAAAMGLPRGAPRHVAGPPGGGGPDLSQFAALQSTLASTVVSHITSSHAQLAADMAKQQAAFAEQFAKECFAKVSEGQAAISQQIDERFAYYEDRLVGVENRVDELEQLKHELELLRREMLVVKSATPTAPAASPAWDRPIDLGIVVVNAREPIPKASLGGALAEVVRDSGTNPEHFTVEGEAIGSRFVLRFTGTAGLAARRAQKFLQGSQNSKKTWKDIVAQTPTGAQVRVSVGPDKNRRMVAHELLLKKAQRAVVHLLDRKVFIDKREYTLSINWKHFLCIEVPDAASGPKLRWNMAALRALGLERAPLEQAVKGALEPEAAEWCL